MGSNALLNRQHLPANLRDQFWLLSRKYRNPMQQDLGQLAQLERNRTKDTLAGPWDNFLGGTTNAQLSTAASRNWGPYANDDGDPLATLSVMFCSRANWSSENTVVEPFDMDRYPEANSAYFLFVDHFSDYVWVEFGTDLRKATKALFKRLRQTCPGYQVLELRDQIGDVIYERGAGWSDYYAEESSKQQWLALADRRINAKVENLERISGLTRVFWQATLQHAVDLHNMLVQKCPQERKKVPYLWLRSPMIGTDEAIRNLDRCYNELAVYGHSVSLPERLPKVNGEDDFDWALGDFGDPALYMGFHSLDCPDPAYLSLRDFQWRSYDKLIELEAPIWFGGITAAAYATEDDMLSFAEMAARFRKMFIQNAYNRNDLGYADFADAEQRKLRQNDRKRAKRARRRRGNTDLFKDGE